MSRAVLVAPLVAAAMALSSSARADLGDWRTPFAEIKFFTGGGASFATSQRAISADLTRSGWAALPSTMPSFGLGFGLAFFGWSLDLTIHGSDITFQNQAGSPIGMDYHRGAIGAELGYRLWLGRWLSVSPHLGLTSLSSTLCFAGHPSATSATSRPPFEQVLRNPGQQTCLSSSAGGADIGLASAWNLRIQFPTSNREVYGLALSVGPRVSYSLPFSTSRTWGEEGTTDNRKELPSFQGPIAPLGEAYLGLEFQVRFVAETLVFNEVIHDPDHDEERRARERRSRR